MQNIHSDQSADIVHLLNERLVEAQIKNPRFSLRAFSKSLNIPAPIVSEVLRGKRNCSYALTKRFCDALFLSQEQTQFILKRFESEKSSKSVFRKLIKKDFAQRYLSISNDQFRAVADWYYFAILALAETKGFKSDSSWIANRLGLTKQEVENAVKTLIRLGLLKKSKNRILATGAQFTTTTDISNIAIKKNHFQGLEKAQEALLHVDVCEREFGSNTIAITKDKLPEAKQAIREFRRKISGLLAEGEKTEVYRLNVQLFPLSKEIK